MSSGDRVFFMQQKSQWIKSKAKEIFWSILSWEPEKVETEISIFSRGIGMHCNALEFIEMHWKEERIKGEILYRMEQLISGQPILSTLISGHIFHHLLSPCGNFVVAGSIFESAQAQRLHRQQRWRAGWRKLLSRC